MFAVRNNCAINLDRVLDVFIGSRKNELIFRFPKYNENEPETLRLRCFTFLNENDARLAFSMIFDQNNWYNKLNVVHLNDDAIERERLRRGESRCL